MALIDKFVSFQEEHNHVINEEVNFILHVFTL